jgi:hypothetical protein
MIVVNKIRCTHCSDVIESTHSHDFKWCKCGRSGVDGGHEYLRRVGSSYEELSRNALCRKTIITNKIQCIMCSDVIESTHCHDFKYCSCGNCAVDGGHEYLRRIGSLYKELSRHEWIEI